MKRLNNTFAQHACVGLLAAVGVLGLAACDQANAPAPVAHGHGGNHGASANSNALAISPAVERNLGMTYAQVERRAVTQTLRVPGQFELLPTATRDYHAALSGRLELHVEQYVSVEPGAVLATVDSPDWRTQQASLTKAEAALQTAQAAVTVAEVAKREQRQRIELLEQRIRRLAAAEVRRIDLDHDLAQARLVVPRLDAELSAAQAVAREAAAQLRASLLTASATTGLGVEHLTQNAGEEGEQSVPRWQTLDRIPILAAAAGVIDALPVTSGQWVQTGDELFTVIQPKRLRLRAEALLADAGQLSSGLPARIAPPSGTGESINDAAAGKLVVGPTAHAEDRTITLYVTPEKPLQWARAGVAAFLEITLNPEAPTELAIPRSAIVQDGLEFVFFRRNPKNPQEVRRVIADTGLSDGRWVEVFSGVLEGDQVVDHGVYQLLAASSSTIQKGGHFHADGTFHEGEDH